MKSGGTFFEEPEFAALADVLDRTVVVDSMIVKTGDVERKSFDPAEPKESGLPPLHLYLSVCSLNASHCEAVIKPRTPSSSGSGSGCGDSGGDSKAAVQTAMIPEERKADDMRRAAEAMAKSANKGRPPEAAVKEDGGPALISDLD